uniref:Cysteine-rich PDZ-binding protein n=1 Tax=Ornithorhynchus anatinus TaxID=9258 RepID=A0A6I8P2F6_ORNAN
MVCEQCEKKLGTVITPDTWKDGARNTTESGGRKLNENKALTSKRARHLCDVREKGLGHQELQADVRLASGRLPGPAALPSSPFYFPKPGGADFIPTCRRGSASGTGQLGLGLGGGPRDPFDFSPRWIPRPAVSIFPSQSFSARGLGPAPPLPSSAVVMRSH